MTNAVQDRDAAWGDSSSQEEESVSDRVWTLQMARFYNLFPYPSRPLWIFPDPKRMLLAHGGFATLLAQGHVSEARTVWRVCHRGGTHAGVGSHSQQKPRELFTLLKAVWGPGRLILLAGCGTDEAVLYRRLHRESAIDAVDISRHSLVRTQLKLILDGLVKLPSRLFRVMELSAPLRLHCGDVLTVLKSNCPERRYDLIVCYGVLHHQRDPRRFLTVLTQSVKPEGYLRLMIYSRKGRGLERSSQRLMGVRSRFPGIRLFIKALNLQAWLWLSRLKTHGSTMTRFSYLRGTGRAGVADALLHPCDPGLDPSMLGEWIDELGYKVIYCCAKSETRGWLSGIESARETWQDILEEEAASRLVSNIELIVTASRS